jgi:Family of unknown function (DUF5343)
MVKKHPYVASGGPLLKTIDQLRRSFPREVTAETLKKLGVAPKNESYVINVLRFNVLRFLGIIDEEGKKVDVKATAFVQHKDEAFATEFEKLVREAYKELFDLHGDQAWQLDKANLTQFFRTSDHSTEVVGTRQAGTFIHLASLAGHTEVPPPREGQVQKKGPANRKERQLRSKPAAARATKSEKTDRDGATVVPRLGLTVRIEVNLPAEGDQQTYDMIFQSIQRNLIDAE